jgi:hypothetical protein
VYEETDSTAQAVTKGADLASLLAWLVEERDPCALPFILAPGLVELLFDLDSPAEVSHTVLEFVQGLQRVAQIRNEQLEGVVA